MKKTILACLCIAGCHNPMEQGNQREYIGLPKTVPLGLQEDYWSISPGYPSFWHYLERDLEEQEMLEDRGRVLE